ncbi:uncharacterized protein MELLADRAFT_104648 [Melampsora larici-populina 98AG31]|uniref:Uncharacterized protein n=1 Tax=Melampsora larici-populina (strain 98AG31 / pathotype 3-4-7) TaxID=747676 RepID=F4RFF4_MELLP|nr:uncharacterized protein MELLADRAFT_104648 [Melampsora larici-populina 98AG31]EGG08939.1 hypothetical protein MELLADRAFT_104648 [Melampsora larici-populina 98AG31]
MDNPFVYGGPLQHINPLDGSFNPNWDTTGTTIESHADILTGRGVVVWGGQGTPNLPGNGPNHNANRHSRPYLGGNFNPLYHKKKKLARETRSQPYYNPHHYNPNHLNQSTSHYNNQHGNYHQNNHQSFVRRGVNNNRGGRGRGNSHHGNGGRPAIGQGSFNPAVGQGNYQRLAIEASNNAEGSSSGNSNNQNNQ